nr:YggT family protein [Clostridia bacterium]
MILRQLVYVIVTFVNILLMAEQMMMFARAILSWIPLDDDGPVTRFLYAMTEPLIMPVRMLLDRIPSVRDLPIDISFIATYMLLTLVQMALPSVSM